MWVLKRDGESFVGSENSVYYLIVGEHLVGRKDCPIQVAGDQTVSRKHAQLIVAQNGNTSTCPVQVTLKDLSKFGTYVNGTKCRISVNMKLNSGDRITFGTQGSTYKLNYEPFIIFASCLENSRKKMLHSQVGKLGGYMVNEWQKGCTHLVMDALSFTVKVIYALVSCLPIVKASYFQDLFEAINSKSVLPSTEKYMPPIKEELIDPNAVSFQPNKARKSIFIGKLFLFLEKKQYKRLHEAIALAGGRSLLKEVGDVPDDDQLLGDENTLVVSVDLKSDVPEDREAWIGHVYDILTSCNRRPIADTEIGLAILDLSLEEYCNSSVDHVPRITRHIVNKSLSTMEAMSQKVSESQNISLISLPEKKPFSTRGNGEQSKIPRNNSTSERTSLETIRKRSRGTSSDAAPLASDTPLSEKSNSETKRRKLSTSVSDITHISQTQPPHIRRRVTDMLSTSNSSKQANNRGTEEVTHISLNQNAELEENYDDLFPDVLKDEERHRNGNEEENAEDGLSGNKRAVSLTDEKVCVYSDFSSDKKADACASQIDVTHVAQSLSQNSSIEERTTFSDTFSGKTRLTTRRGRNLKFKVKKEPNLTHSPTDTTHTSQTRSQSSGVEEKPIDSSSNDPTGMKRLRSTTSKTEVSRISLNQHSEIESKPSNHLTCGRTGSKRLKLSSPKTEVTLVSEIPESPPEDLRVAQTPSPEIPCQIKRTRLSPLKPVVTDISQVQHFGIEGLDDVSLKECISERDRTNSFTSKETSKQIFKQEKLDNTPSSGFKYLTNADMTFPFDNSNKERSSAVLDKDAKLIVKTEPGTSDAKQSLSEQKVDKPDVLKEGRGDKILSQPKMVSVENVGNMATVGSGWISKKSSIRVKKEASEMLPICMTESADNYRNGVNEILSCGREKELSEQGFLSKQEGRQELRLTEVKPEDIETGIPTDLVCIEHVELIVTRRVTRTEYVAEDKTGTTLQNMKRFQKQNYAGGGSGLPRIIGGSDLVAFSSRAKDVEDWFAKIQEMNREQDMEDQAADNLFRYEPGNKRNRR